MYWIGINNVYFNKWVFWRWFFYGMGQSTLIMFVCYYTTASLSPTYSGHTGTQQAAGNLIFIVLVIAVNIKVLVSSYQYSWVIVALVVLSDAATVAAFYWVANTSLFPSYLGNFAALYTAPETYTAMIFCTFAFVLWDVGTERTNTEIRKWRRDARVRAEHEQKRK